MSVFDVVVLLAFIAVAVVGAELVRRTCRRQLTSIRTHQSAAQAAPVTAATPAGVGTAELD